MNTAGLRAASDCLPWDAVAPKVALEAAPEPRGGVARARGANARVLLFLLLRLLLLRTRLPAQQPRHPIVD